MLRRRFVFGIAVVAAAVAATLAVAAFVRGSDTDAKSRAASVTVDLRMPLQLMQGFGSSERVWDDPHMSNSPTTIVPRAAQDEILTALYRRLGLTRVRVVLDPGIQPKRGAAFDFSGKFGETQIAFIKQAKTFGLETFFPGPVYLEEWLTPADVGPYVDYAMGVLRYWRSQGLEPPLYAPLNEPRENGDFPAEWMHDVVVELGRRLQAEGFRTKLVVPDDVDPGAAYRRAEAVLRDREARKYVAAIAFHIYRGNENEWADLARLANRYRMPLWMTEYVETKGYATWPAALRWATTMSDLVTVGDVGAIDYLWGFFGDWNGPSGALINIEFDHGAYRGYSYTPVYWITGQYSRFVRPGYRRVSTTSSAALPISAFTGDKRVILVAINTHDQARTLRVSVVGGRTRGPASAVRTSKAENWKSLPPLRVRGGKFTGVLAPQSITTFIVQRAA